jgi:membrane protein
MADDRLRGSELLRLGLAYVLVASTTRATSEKELPRNPPHAPGASGSSAASGSTSPQQIPARGWWDIAKSVWAKIGKDRVIAVAAGLTFYAILALFPAITALVSIYGLFADPLQIQQQMAQLSGIVPEGAISVVSDQVKLLAAQGNSVLGFAFITGLAIALWSANAGVKALFDALNVAYEETETRGFFRLNAISLLFTVSAVALVLVAFGSTVILPWILEHAFFGYTGTATVIRWLRWPIGILISLFVLAVVYRFGPARKKPAWRWVTPGSLFASIVWLIASGGFAYYAANFGSYNKTYGTLGAAIGLMTWMWISGIVVLVGAELNAEAEREAKGDTPTADKNQKVTR